jgi:hypothetical protein
VNLVEMPMYYAGGGFPWGLLIIGGILFFLWQKGMFGGPGGRGYNQGQGQGPMFSGPRERFEEWHREAHAAPTSAQAPVQPASPAPAAYGAAPPAANPPAPAAAPQPPQGEQPGPVAGATGPTLEQW